MTYLLVGLAIWIYCGYCNYGYTFAFFNDEFPSIAKEMRVENQRFALFMMLTGPIGRIAIFFVNGTKHGWRLR